ncbi:hypothetical protein DDF67_13225 [Caulobacter endophyticus]|uniref:DNA polymerase Y-family little finger domain-containing protein n=1 Tax=Caulobacter endophyticus TaxID=2172652 RepID=A0A2T9JXZ5_9CAUL|nr:hypothetical protein DDF67_13225 [Caulobacter endophyticus]
MKYADFAQATRHWSLAAPISDAATLRLLAQDLVRSVYPLRTGVRLLGVTVSSFASAPPSVQAALPV